MNSWPIFTRNDSVPFSVFRYCFIHKRCSRNKTIIMLFFRCVLNVITLILVSGVLASFCYAALCDLGLTPTTTLLMMLVVPLVGMIAFLLTKESNNANSSPLLDDEIDENDSNTVETSLPVSPTEKWRYLPQLTKFFIPMLINCLLEYMIGQMVGSNEFSTEN